MWSLSHTVYVDLQVLLGNVFSLLLTMLLLLLSRFSRVRFCVTP